MAHYKCSQASSGEAWVPRTRRVGDVQNGEYNTCKNKTSVDTSVCVKAVKDTFYSEKAIVSFSPFLWLPNIAYMSGPGEAQVPVITRHLELASHQHPLTDNILPLWPSVQNKRLLLFV